MLMGYLPDKPDARTAGMQQVAEQRKPRGRLPATELTEKREREIAALEAAVAKQKNRLEELKNAQNRAQRNARRAELNQRKYAAGGLVQIAALLDADAGFMLGALLFISDQREPGGTWPSSVFLKYKTRGDLVLAERAVARRARKRAEDDNEDNS